MAGRLAVIGAGLMGSGIAQVSAQAGWQVTMRDVDDASLQRGLSAIRDSLGRFAAKGKIAAEDVDATLDKALATDDQSVVVDFRVDTHEGVFPMVPAGRPNDEIILGPEFSPEEQAAATRREVRA